jgi:outer membrane immunogenic protein
MKKQLLCGAAAGAITAVLIGPGFSADLPVKAPPRPAAPIPYNWSGCYIGGHIGWGRTKFNGTWFGDSDTTVFPGNRPDGGLGGVLGGCNWQANSTWVLGLEGDVSWLNWKTDSFFSPTDGGEDNIHAKLNMLASLRARLGIAFDRTLLYVTGGLGYAHGKVYAFDVGGPPTTLDESFGKWGGVFGGGIEYAFTNNILGRVEGMYYFFNESRTFVGTNDSALLQLKDVGLVRVALSYKFGP